MEFTLVYRGPLKANGRPHDKQKIRRAFHGQLKELWKQEPLVGFSRYLKKAPENGEITVIRTVGNFHFAPLVTQQLRLIAELHVTLLRPEAPGSIVTQGGDIDNRIKTLLDSLRMPHKESELPKDEFPLEGDDPFYCLLEDDNLITSLSVNTDRLLEPVDTQSDVQLLLRVATKATAMVWGNMGLG